MNDEIKEILEDLKDEDCYWLDCGRKNTSLSYEEAHLLLDYITNLQQENERLKEKIKYASDKLNWKIKKGDKND